MFADRVLQQGARSIGVAAGEKERCVCVGSVPRKALMSPEELLCIHLNHAPANGYIQYPVGTSAATGRSHYVERVIHLCAEISSSKVNYTRRTDETTQCDTHLLPT